MIVRVSEALIRDDATAEFMARLRALVATFPDQFPGLERHEVLIDTTDERRVQYVSVWQDEDSLIAYAGCGWRTDPVTFPDEDRLLAEPLTLRHFQIDQ